MGNFDGRTVVSKDKRGRSMSAGIERIAFYISTLQVGGAERVICNLANGFCEKGSKVYMITENPDGKESYPLHPDVERVMLEAPKRGSRLHKAAARITILRRCVKELGVQILVSFIGKANIRAVLATRFTSTKVIVSVRSAPAREYGTKVRRVLAKVLFRFAEGAVFQTEEARDFFAPSVRKKAVVLMSPLHADFIRPRYDGERKHEVVTVGRLHKVKNHEMLIRSFAAVWPDYPDYVLKLYGDGEMKEKLTALIAELNMGQSVVLMGNCSHVADAIREADIFVLSSDVEGMPNALLEAMALGLACISTDCPCGGPRTVIRDGENGLLIPVGDTDALERALRKVLSDAELKERLGINAAQIQKELDPQRVDQMWMDYIAARMKKNG